LLVAAGLRVTFHIISMYWKSRITVGPVKSFAIKAIFGSQHDERPGFAGL
jgi:hypothetical protein